MQLLQNDVEFWACGIFVINETLVFSVSSLILMRTKLTNFVHF